MAKAKFENVPRIVGRMYVDHFQDGRETGPQSRLQMTHARMSRIYGQHWRQRFMPKYIGTIDINPNGLMSVYDIIALKPGGQPDDRPYILNDEALGGLKYIYLLATKDTEEESTSSKLDQITGICEEVLGRETVEKLNQLGEV